MSWLDLPRVPEPEMMDDSDEVEAYSSAAAQAYLEKIDDTFIEHAVRLMAGRTTGRALDIGTGPGQIVLKLARRWPGWQFIGVDRSPNMIRQARSSLAEPSDPGKHVGAPLAAPLGGVPRPAVAGSGQASPVPPHDASRMARVQFFVADGNRLPFADADFDLVTCNSVLHHLARPQGLFAEVSRLAKPGGAILIRDLRRTSRLVYPLHIRWHGRHYSGLMYKLYCASVRSAYTVAELEEMLRVSPLGGTGPELAPSTALRACAAGRGARVFAHGRTHLGLERPSHP